MKYQNKQTPKNNKRTLIFALIIFIALGLGAGIYIYTQSNRSSKVEQHSNPDDIPKLKNSDKSTDEETQSHEDKPADDQQPTRVEGKTPTQYEDEKINDTPAYNNEQFRIPEDNL